MSTSFWSAVSKTQQHVGPAETSHICLHTHTHTHTNLLASGHYIGLRWLTWADWSRSSGFEQQTSLKTTEEEERGEEERKIYKTNWRQQQRPDVLIWTNRVLFLHLHRTAVKVGLRYTSPTGCDISRGRGQPETDKWTRKWFKTCFFPSLLPVPIIPFRLSNICWFHSSTSQNRPKEIIFKWKRKKVRVHHRHVLLQRKKMSGEVFRDFSDVGKRRQKS